MFSSNPESASEPWYAAGIARVPMQALIMILFSPLSALFRHKEKLLSDLTRSRFFAPELINT
jgi:hypothetical protein